MFNNNMRDFYKTTIEFFDDLDKFYEKPSLALPLYIPMAGASKEMISVEINNRLLTIKADIKVGKYNEKIEKVYSIASSIDPDSIKVKLENGLLILDFDKKSEQPKTSRKINIE